MAVLIKVSKFLTYYKSYLDFWENTWVKFTMSVLVSRSITSFWFSLLCEDFLLKIVIVRMKLSKASINIQEN